MPHSVHRTPRLRISILLVAVLIGSTSVVGAESAKPRVEYSAVQAGMGKVSVYAPGKWGLLNLSIRNPHDEPLELLSATYFDGQPTTQFGRRLWVPVKARLFSWQPVLIPGVASTGKKDQAGVHSLVFDAASTGDAALRDASGQLLHEGVLPLQLESPITGLVDARDAGGLSDTALDLVMALRVSRKLHPRVFGFPGESYALDSVSFSPDEASWQPLNQLVLADSRALLDPAGLPAMRRWVHGGGRLWVMLDRVEPRLLERILGDEFVCDVIDRVGLTTVRIEPTSADSGAPAIETEYEEPVDFVRTMVTGVDVAYTVNGWPAAFWKSFGGGRVLVTTLAPRGWMRERTAADTDLWSLPAESLEAGRGNRFVPLPPMAELGKEFLVRPGAADPVPEILEPVASEYIGYSIPPRWMIVILLGTFVAAIVVLGLWNLRRKSLERLGWISPGLSLSATLVLLVIGVRNRHTIPATAATVDVVETIAGTDDVRTRGAVALYNPEATASVLASTQGGRMIPELTGLEGAVKRLVWKDFHQSQWENLSLGAGEKLATFAQFESRPERIEARGTFDARGLSGRVSVPGAARLGDALIATRLGRLGVDLQATGEFRAGATNVFGRNQYVAAGLLNDEQDRRRRTYEQVVPGVFRDDSSGRPLLFVWADRHGAGFQFDEGRRLVGDSLVSVPLTLERPPALTPVRIPALFLPFRNAPHPDGTISSPLWDHRRQEWIERSAPASAWLRFQLPVELLPVELTGARIVISVVGPVGRVEVSALRRKRVAEGDRDQTVVIQTWQAPVGTLSPAEITDPELLQLDDAGGLLLGLAAGQAAGPDSKGPESKGSATPGGGSRISAWRIESLSLELSGKTSP